MSNNNGNYRQQEYFPRGGKYLVSGLAPGNTGTGRFFRVLLRHALKHDFAIVSPMPGLDISPEQQEQMQTIRESTVTILHPQFLGLSVTERLLTNNHDIRLYVLDNGFFCTQSYNHAPGELNECLHCLGDPRNISTKSNCPPRPVASPVHYPITENTEFLVSLQRHAAKITFFCQTLGQEKLLKMHFGAYITTHIVGMTTDEWRADEEVAHPRTTYDLVYHAAALEAKGALYSLQLALRLPQFSFLFPCAPDDLFKSLGYTIEIPANCTFQPMSWDSGLKEHVAHCKMVLVPSLWSAPVEGALIKSVFYNGRVGVFDTEFGFHNEIPEQFLCRLNADLQKSADAITTMLPTTTRRAEARAWAHSYSQAVNLDHVFTLNSKPDRRHFSQGTES